MFIFTFLFLHCSGIKHFRLLKRNSLHQNLNQSWSLNEQLVCVPSENSPKTTRFSFYYSVVLLVWTWWTYGLSQSDTKEAQEHKHLQHGCIYRTGTKMQKDTRKLQKKIKEESYSSVEEVSKGMRRCRSSSQHGDLYTVRGWMLISPTGCLVGKYQASFHPEFQVCLMRPHLKR